MERTAMTIYFMICWWVIARRYYLHSSPFIFVLLLGLPSSVRIFCGCDDVMAAAASVDEDSSDPATLADDKSQSTSSASLFEIAGYLPEYRSYINVNNTAPYLTDLIAFSVMPSADGDNNGASGNNYFTAKSSCCLEPRHYQQIRDARSFKKENDPGSSNLSLWVTLGGAGRCDTFKAIIGSPGSSKQRQLVSNLIDICTREELDGINLDCLTPTNQKEVNDYLQFLAILSSAFRQYKHRTLKLSITLHPGQHLPPKAYELVDRLLIMTYDMPAPDGHHASLEIVKNTIQGFLDHNAPNSKILLGIPAYARHSVNPGMVKTFSELMDEMKPSSLEEADVGEWGGYPFDSPHMIKAKVVLAREMGLSGLFFWELGQDKQHPSLGPGGLLLEAAYREATRNQAEDYGISEEL